MSVTSAINSFLGREGHKRVNCAQSVLSSVRGKFAIDEAIIQSFRSYGGGKAPDGLCGAFYAVKYLAEENSIPKMDEFEKFFMEEAGSVKCKEIRKCKKFSCVDCIAKCAEFLGESESNRGSG